MNVSFPDKHDSGVIHGISNFPIKTTMKVKTTFIVKSKVKTTFIVVWKGSLEPQHWTH